MQFAQLPELDRWKAKPKHLLLAVIIFAVLFGGTLFSGHRIITGSHMTPEALAKARTGTILVPTKDGQRCDQILFHNDTGAFSGAKPTSCGAPRTDDTQLGAIRRGFRGYSQ